MNLAYPYRFDHRGYTAAATDDTHLRDLIEQVLFTSPGERVMLPDFGSGVLQMVFAPNSFELASATQVLIQSGLQRWLGHLLTVRSVDVQADDATLTISVTFQGLASGQWRLETFQRDREGSP
ncbi:MAG: GPW/gp25 family protein [Luteibacter sp.]